MEATGRDGGAGGPSWSYRRRHEEIGSSSYTISSSSRSGTIVSSIAYTSGASRSSRLSSGISMEAAALMELELELGLGTPELDKKDAEFGQAIKKHRKEIEEATLKETRMYRIESLVLEFFRGPSDNRSILGGGSGGILERWFSELGVSWVLQLDVRHPPRGAVPWTWIKALEKIMETIRLTESFFADHGHGVVGMPGISEEEEVERGKQATTSLDPVQFALFFQETMSRMLVFVDVMFSESLFTSTWVGYSLYHGLHIHRALSKVLSGIRLQFHSSPTAEVEKIEKEMVSLLSAKQEKAFEAICGGGMSALKRWFSELGVSWVLQLDVRHPPRGAVPWTWIKALEKIMETIRLTDSFFADHGHGVVGMSGISEEEEVESGKQATTSLDPVQFALFFQETMSRMLVFVDVMFSESLSTSTCVGYSLYHGLHIHSALSKVLSGIRLQFHSSPTAEVEKIEKEMVSLLSAMQEKAFEAIWSFMEETRIRALKSMEDSLGAETPQGSSDIHQATCSVMNHIKFLLCSCWAVDPLFVSKAASLGKYVPQTGLEEAQPFVSMIVEMVSFLEEKLITKSQSFLDKGLGLLFLLNNSNFIREQLQGRLSYISVDFAAVISSITGKVEHYAESYIEVSWEPMLACLFNPTPLRLVRKYSPLSKFESEFQKIHSTQMLWKVPDPKLKKKLRKAIIEKIIPGYTKYIEDSKVTNPKFTPQELEENLQELFEG